MSWATLEAEDGELADFGVRRFAASHVAYLATVDEDGAPRVHPLTPIVTSGHLFVFMEPTSPKGRDLQRGSKYALHSAVADQHGGGGEFRVAGTGQRVDDPSLRALASACAPYTPAERHVLFELLVEDALQTVYADDGTAVRRRWRTVGEVTRQDGANARDAVG